MKLDNDLSSISCKSYEEEAHESLRKKYKEFGNIEGIEKDKDEIFDMNSLLDNSGSGRSILNDIHRSINRSRRSKKKNSTNRSKNKIRSINNSVLSEKSNNGISNINRDTEL